MNDSVRDALHPDPEPLVGTVQVLVTLAAPSADDESLERLRILGVHVERVIGHKVVGTIDAKLLAKLCSDPLVVDAEESAALPPS